ncbi:MAG TPA: radical SAM protein [Myxococcota bacterium]|nr:radical SAM protein [Myxococcota bacterium]
MKVGYRCNNNCVFCHSAPHRGINSTIEQIEKKIQRAASLGANMLVLSGGEPTIRTDLLDISDRAGMAGMTLGLVTNGRMLAYGNLVEKLIERRLGYVYVSLCAPDAELHDRHAQVESFNQTIKGLQHLPGVVDELTINVVVTDWNIDSLDGMPALAAKLAPLRLKFSMVEPEGNALDNFKTLVPSLKRASEAVTGIIEQLSDSDDISYAVDGFPLCLLPDHIRHIESGLREDGFFIISEAFEDDWHPIDDQNRGFGTVCIQCSLQRRCRGVYRQYLEQRGDDELQPLARNVSNSFNMKPSSPPLPFSLRCCPIRSGSMPPPDPVRGLAVYLGDERARFYHATTRDFSDLTIRHAIRDLGQVYQDKSDKLLSNDLGSDLDRLALAGICPECSLRALCGGIFEPTKEPSFERAKEILGGVLGKLRGTLLDIGCGRSPYLNAMHAAIDEHALSYLGIDPDVENKEYRASVSFERTTFDDFHRNGPPFDTVCALRSLNHLPSVNTAISKMAALTVPGGRVILAEDEVFSVVRKARVTQQVESQTGLPFEHLTNLQLEEVKKLCEGCGLVTEQQFSTDDTKSTLWLLVCRKRKI